MFASVLSGIYLSGTLHHTTLIDDGKGGWSSVVNDYPIKGHRNTANEEMMRFNLATGPGAVESGHTGVVAKLIVLQEGVPHEITTNDQITLAGARWSVFSVDTDPAASHWVLGAVQLRNGAGGGTGDTGESV